MRVAGGGGVGAGRWRLFSGLLAVGLTLGCAAGAEGASWGAMKEKIRHRFPTVVHITTNELAAWLADPTRPPPLLLDVRAPEEYAVSHLQGAQLAPDLAAARRLLAGRPASTPVVVYCSVGYRSAALARELKRAGFTGVRNLEGSIFAWANEGRPVYRGERQVRAVHPYDRRWGRFLHWALCSWRPTPGERAEAPASRQADGSSRQ